MIIVERGNVVLRVTDDLLDHYVAKGYTAKTTEGKILKEAIPTDVGALQAAYAKHTQEIKALKNKIAELEQQKVVSDDDKPKKKRRISEEE